MISKICWAINASTNREHVHTSLKNYQEQSSLIKQQKIEDEVKSVPFSLRKGNSFAQGQWCREWTSRFKVLGYAQWKNGNKLNKDLN
jgi:hypothetical protein